MATIASADILRKASYVIFADAREFYLWDAAAGPDASVFTQAAGHSRLRTAPRVVVVEVQSRALLLDFELVGGEPKRELADWDYVVEASLDLPSGGLEIHECAGRSIDLIDVVPGSYRVRACFARGERYKLIVWPAAPAAFAVLKGRAER